MPSVNPYNAPKLPHPLLLIALFLRFKGFGFLSKTFQSPNNLHKDCLHFSEVRIVGLGDADRLAILQGCPGIPGVSGPKGEPGLPGRKGEAPKASDEHCDMRWFCCFG